MARQKKNQVEETLTLEEIEERIIKIFEDLKDSNAKIYKKLHYGPKPILNDICGIKKINNILHISLTNDRTYNINHINLIREFDPSEWKLSLRDKTKKDLPSDLIKLIKKYNEIQN